MTDKTTSHPPQPRLLWVNIVATVVGVLALVAILVALHLGQLYDVFNSDSAYLPLVLEDILADPANFRHWYPPTTSFYFPEWILFGLPYLITRSFYFSMAAVIVLHTLILFAIVYGINRQIDRSQAWVASVATTVLLLFLGLQDGYVREHDPFVSAFRLMWYNLWHYGALLMSLWSFLVLVKLQTHPHTTRQYALRVSLLGLLVFLSVTSNQIMIVWFSGPAIATLAYQWLTTRVARDPATRSPVTCDPVTCDPVTCDPVTCDPVTRDPVALTTTRIYYTMGVIATSSIVGKLIYPLTVVHDFATGRSLLFLSGMVEDIRRTLLFTAIEFSLFPIIVCWIVGLHLLVLVWLVWHRKKFTRVPAPLRLSMVYTFMTFVAIATAVLFTHSPFAKRYFLPTYILPLILAPSLGVYWYRHTFKSTSTTHISYALLVVCGVLLQVTGLKIVQKNDEIQPNIFAYTFDELQCVDQVIARYNLRYGVAGYEYAKALQAMSAHDIEIAQYYYDKTNLSLIEFHWITQPQYFRSRYDFAITSVDSITKNFNREWRNAFLRDHPVPLHRTVCGSKEVFIYPNGGLVMDTE